MSGRIALSFTKFYKDSVILIDCRNKKYLGNNVPTITSK